MCIPLANEGVGLGPSRAGPVASRPPLVGRSASVVTRCFFTRAFFHARVFRAWWLASDSSGSRSSREGVLACIQGASDSLRHPSTGGETESSVFGIAVRVLLRATSLPHGMVSSLRRTEVCPSLP